MSPLNKVNFLFNENLDTNSIQCIAANLLPSRENIGTTFNIELQNLQVKRSEAKNLKSSKCGHHNAQKLKKF